MSIASDDHHPIERVITVTAWVNWFLEGEFRTSAQVTDLNAAERALQSALASAQLHGHQLLQVKNLHAWTVRDHSGAVIQAWWLSVERGGPASSAMRRN